MSAVPTQLTLTGPSVSVFQQAAYLCTQGFKFADWQMDQAIPSYQCTLIMVLGKVDAADIAAAKQAITAAGATA
jgi:hypothetical protein